MNITLEQIDNMNYDEILTGVKDESGGIRYARKSADGKWHCYPYKQKLKSSEQVLSFLKGREILIDHSEKESDGFDTYDANSEIGYLVKNMLE